MTQTRKNAFKRAVSAAMSAILAISLLQTGGSTRAFADDGTENASDLARSSETGSTSSTSENAYRHYIERYGDAAKPLEEVSVDITNFTSSGGEFEKTDFEGEKDVISWLESEGTISWEFDVKTAGLYNMRMLYYPVAGQNTTVEIEVKLDGDYPFSETKLIELDRYWRSKTASIEYDALNKNQKRPPQVEYDCWVDYPIKDKDGLINTPYFFYLSEGKHTLSFTGVKTNIYMKSISFYNSEELPSYADIRPSQAEIDNTPALSNGESILVEAETPKYTTSSTLYPTYDRTDYTMSPSHPVNKRYNTIGADTWSKATQTAVYEVEVPADGYYTINMKCRQSTMRGFFSNRRVYINGEVSCKELDDVKIQYSPKWQTVSLMTEDDEPIYVKLNAGKNTIAFEAIPGDIGEVMERLDDIILRLNQYYRRIVMITSTDPDEYKDYMLEDQIPELIDVFKETIDALYAEKEGIEKLSGQGSEATTLETLAVILNMAVKHPENIPMMVSWRSSGIRDQINAVSAWMRDYRGQPLEMDYFEVKTVHENFKKAKANFFKQFGFGFKSFIGSFFEDYTSVSADGDGKSLNVWVSLGRDQATVINELVASEYNPEHRTQIGIRLVQGAILEATLADKGPEAALFIGGDFPVVCASRGLMVNLKEMNGYEEVAKRFPENLATLYQYEDGVYGLPLTDSFPMMFYRTDVLEELGQTPPETWDGLIKMLPDLQRRYLRVGLILPSNISSQVFDAGNTFVLLMNQTGQDFYNEQQTSTTFDTEAAVEAFTKWTNFYTIHDFQQVYDAFSLFRTGEMPILIQNYASFYSQLSVSAPEIKGLWSFTHVPGTERVVNGETIIDYSANSGSAGAVIFKGCSDIEAAWDFITWFTSTDVQVEYGKTIEAVMGPMGRYDTANKEALAKLNWSTAEYNKISDQMNNLKEVPIIPASYAVTRSVYNAFRAVVNNQKNARFQLSSYNRDANAEILRKLRDLGYEIDEDGNIIR
ncbi:MAG: extracellular solute-binding protein [Oscillospiraceae bacterium]|nr:extracellular solute-binding protein [Oscillospiraceae bacterium]